jgi:hypothetical protein
MSEGVWCETIAPFGEQILDHAQAQWEEQLELDGLSARGGGYEGTCHY